MSELPLGKTLPNTRYIHTCALSILPEEYSDLVDAAAAIADASPGEFNVVKFDLANPRVSLLSYPLFFENGFPALEKSWAVDLTVESASSREYAPDTNRPILHRKETLIPPDHALWVQFNRLTRSAEDAGLFEDSKDIGREGPWNAKLRRVGLVVRGNELVEVKRSDQEPEEEIARHRTALVRYSLSAPMQQLWTHGYLDGAHSVFDYGCGRGDDVRALSSRDIKASGWDPHFADDNQLQRADVVNLGFVLNVIEDAEERDDALAGAWALTDKLLAVAVMLGGRSIYERFRLYRDGVITRRGTFQKYFTQNELRQYIAETLDREPVAVSPGIFFVFKDEKEEQKFLAARQLSGIRSTPLMRRRRRPTPVKRPPKPTKWETHRELIEVFWQRCVGLGRIPEPGEFDRAAELRELVGTPRTVYRRCAEEFGEECVFDSREVRKADRLVYLALNLFERRHSMQMLPDDVRTDVRVFWGSYSAASDEAKDLLFSTGSAETIFNECRKAAEQGLGFLDGQRALTLHTSMTSSLPPVLRVYLGCASHVFGELDRVDLIKIHIRSKKVSLMEYDDFEGRAIPLLMERTKIFLGDADYLVFVYGGEYEPTPLYMKARYIPDGFPRRDEQRLFDQKLAALIELGDDRHGPDSAELELTLDEHGLEVRGFRLQKKRGSSPDPARTEARPMEQELGGVVTEASMTSYDSELPPRRRVRSVRSEQALPHEDKARRFAGMTIIEAVITVLGKSDRPMNAVEIHEAISAAGLFEFKAKDPKGVISSTIGKHLRSAGTRSIEKAGAGTFRAV